MDKVRLLFLPSVDSDNTNAQSLNVREIALRLDPSRFQVTLWYENDPEPRLRDRSGVYLLKLPPRGKTWRILREMLSGYDVIAYMDYSPASYLFLKLRWLLRSKTKTVCHCEAPIAQLSHSSPALRFLYKGVISRCDVYTGISKFVAQDFLSNTKKSVAHILPVGVDTNLFTPPFERGNSSPVVLFAGTLIERKGPQFVIDAAARFPEVTFRLVGGGREGFDEVLRHRIQLEGLMNVVLEGPKTQNQLLDIMRNSDIFLLPSRLEGIPKVTLEASSTGLPCVVSRDYNTPSVIDGITGFQVSNFAEMMRALEKLITDRGLRERMGAAAREHMANFGWDVVAQKWQNAYLEIVSKQAA